ncbi:RagB/SusD family nutrient uptake outer membrane protein [Ohtaekwangia koreensis]|nr:RagB/SusD family nutrient uptake outer membrane protein [Ohtaekwangia koreensis]
MKKHIYTQLIVLTAALLTSCELNETVYSSIFTENFYKTGQDAEAAITAAYDPIGDMYSGPAAVLISDFSADQTYPRAVVGRNTLTLFSYDANYTTQKSFTRTFESPQQVWSSCYDGIEKSNWILEKVPATNMDENRKSQILGEAYFLRAFYHWMLTKNFGDVIIKTKPSITEEEAYAEKKTKAEVYAQIYADLDQALATSLASYPNVAKGRPSKEVVSALYAKAALYNEDWATALQKANDVIASGKYSLVDDPRDLYRPQTEDIARIENMWAFEAETTVPGRSHQLLGLYGPPGSGAPAYGKTTFGSLFAYQSFYNSFDPDDERRLLLDTTYIDKTGKTVPQKSLTPITQKAVLVKKYQEENSVGSNTSCNISILRLADIYLIAAEAEARLNGATTAAYDFIQAVRDRAGLPELASGLSETDFIDAVIQERSWEFFGEGDRWYDLTRTDKFLTVIPAAVNDVYPARTVQPKNKYFPIPQDEINANPLIDQNDPWK